MRFERNNLKTDFNKINDYKIMRKRLKKLFKKK